MYESGRKKIVMSKEER